jgi:DHA2 family multidrug resistance protein
VAGLAGFIWREWTFDHPAVKLKLLTNWNLALGTILSFVVGVILFATVFVFPLFVQIGLGWTATQTGNFMIPGALATAVTMGFTGRLLSKGTNTQSDYGGGYRHGIPVCRHDELFFAGFIRI